jgi:hypothetical protein
MVKSLGFRNKEQKKRPKCTQPTGRERGALGGGKRALKNERIK